MQAVRTGRLERPSSERVATFYAHDLSRLCGQRQREVPQAAKQVGDPIARLHLEQRKRPVYQAAIDVWIHLSEIVGPVSHAQAKLRQRVRQQLAVGWVKQMKRIGPLGLQPP